ncbi:hypothetical protein ACFWY9_24420 [Amycolatopsis sp. NPDC059027]|uniref:hypothetical protein n=1 Tax=unclassified Amycolatopsis TaxID=2618356 RepID=UPI00366F1AB0
MHTRRLIGLLAALTAAAAAPAILATPAQADSAHEVPYCGEEYDVVILNDGPGGAAPCFTTDGGDYEDDGEIILLRAFLPEI